MLWPLRVNYFFGFPGGLVFEKDEKLHGVHLYEVVQICAVNFTAGTAQVTQKVNAWRMPAAICQRVIWLAKTNTSPGAVPRSRHALKHGTQMKNSCAPCFTQTRFSALIGVCDQYIAQLCKLKRVGVQLTQ